jgi:2,3-bisphosphoglycerate-dependent phosphoglycerate mutase
VAVDRAFTSLLSRAVNTLTLALEEMDQVWVPVTKHWRLNERHYGALTGLDKAETKAKYGEEQFMLWRRSYAGPPPPMTAEHPFSVAGDRRYGALAASIVPAAECLADVVVRLMPYWYDTIAPEVAAGRTVMVVAHGNSLRALIKHLDSISEDDIASLEIPTGVPIVYRMDATLGVSERIELGDPQAIAAAAEAVRRQGDREH